MADDYQNPNTVHWQMLDLMEHFRQYKSITPAAAWSLYGIYRLAARVYDLRQKYGWTILTKRVENDWGNSYAQYWLLKLPDHDHPEKLT